MGGGHGWELEVLVLEMYPTRKNAEVLTANASHLTVSGGARPLPLLWRCSSLLKLIYSAFEIISMTTTKLI